MFNLTPTVRNLLLANILIYLLQISLRLSPSITELGSLHLPGSPYFHFWQFFTYMFLHDEHDWWHLGANMFGLISFGPLLEQVWGGPKFLAFWLICGIGAGVFYDGVRDYEQLKLQTAYTELKASPGAGEYSLFMQQVGLPRNAYEGPASALQQSPNNLELRQAVLQNVDEIYQDIHQTRYGMVGASGALFGVLFAFAYLFPNQEMRLLFPPIAIKAKYFVTLYGLFELYGGVHRVPGDRVAHFAHLGGLLIGFIILKVWERDRG